MARYRLLERTFINNSLREAGEIVDYDGQPGSTLQPVETKSKVDIPEDWRDQNGLQRIALARSLGAPKQRLSAADADVWIANELDNRELAKAEPAPKPSILDKLMTPTPAVTPAVAVPSGSPPDDKPTSN